MILAITVQNIATVMRKVRYFCGRLYLRWKKSGALDALFHTDPDGEWGDWKLTARPLASFCDGAKPWHHEEFSRKSLTFE